MSQVGLRFFLKPSWLMVSYLSEMSRFAQGRTGSLFMWVLAVFSIAEFLLPTCGKLVNHLGNQTLIY